MNFYCQNKSGSPEFSIDEWNNAYDEVKDMSEEIQSLVLEGKPCKEQCFDCMAIVGERKIQTNKILKNDKT